VPRYIIERNVGDLSQEDLEAAALRSKDALRTLKGVVWIRSYVSLKEGKIYCEYEAPSPNEILEHARRAELPADKISLVAAEISPEMFV
jgi:hypothetical protein